MKKVSGRKRENNGKKRIHKERANRETDRIGKEGGKSNFLTFAPSDFR
jgi:hypothetical protein